MRTRMLAFIATAVVLAGCAATTYTAPDFDDYASGHSTVAILPFDVTIGTANQRKDIDPDDLVAEAQRQAETFQRAMYMRFLIGQQRGRYSVTFQDVDETNVRLKSAGSESKVDIAGALGVDAVISGRMSLSKPMGTGAAIASTLLLGFGATNEAHINMTIHDGESGTLVWSYEYEASGGLLSTPDRLAKSLVRGVERKFPYKR